MMGYLNNMKTKGFSNLKDAVLQYKKLIGSRSLLILTSDFLFPVEEIKEALYILGEHEIKLIQVLDPIEKDLKFNGDFNLKDSETGDKLRTFISPSLRSKYQQLLDDHSAKIKHECDLMGIDFYQITTDTPIFDAFYKILE